MSTMEQCLAEMMKSDQALYEKILDTPGFAYWFNELCMAAARTPGLEAAARRVVEAEDALTAHWKAIPPLADDWHHRSNELGAARRAALAELRARLGEK